jgi:hypothetical protein
MKFCVDCQFSKKQVIETPKGFVTMLFCENMECRDPVDGSMLPCDLVRKEQVFCAIQAKHFKQKEEPVKATLLEIKL